MRRLRCRIRSLLRVCVCVCVCVGGGLVSCVYHIDPRLQAALDLLRHGKDTDGDGHVDMYSATGHDLAQFIVNRGIPIEIIEDDNPRCPKETGSACTNASVSILIRSGFFHTATADVVLL